MTKILLLLLLLALPPPAALALTAEGLALLAFKAAATDDPYSALSRWSESDPDPCGWPGVRCANASSSSSAPRVVVGLAVAGKNISGYIPSELGSLLFLRRLNLHGNRLSGAIPAALSNASSLHSLYLYGNRLTGGLPTAALCDLPRLHNLDVSGNALSGELPLDLRGCRSLQRLVLARNAFSGELPAGVWPEMPSLQQLDLSSNAFNGSLPPDLGELPRLAGTLNLSHNRFSGVVPPELGRLPATVTLDLRFNNLSGAIPQTGSLASQGPTAFLNNPGLCGYPLQVPCRAVPPPTQSPTPQATTTPLPSSTASASDRHQQPIRTGLIALISVADAAGVALVGIILVYVYWKVKDRKDDHRGCRDDDGDYSTKTGLCRCMLWRHGGSDNSSDTSSSGDDKAGDGKYSGGGGGEGELVAIDRGFRVELDELLRSSAYVLGKGGKGIVYKVVVANGTTPVAVRRLGGGGGGADRCKEFASEARAVGRARHPNVVRLRAYYWSADEKLVVTDFVGNGNLATALRGRPGQTALSWSARLKIARGAARGLAYLHECSPRRFVHGEVKPSNILLDADFTPRVADFGLASLLAVAGCAPDGPPSSGGAGGLLGGAIPYVKPPVAPGTGPDRFAGSGYRAPEARAAGAKPTQKWDVFSFGVVLLELLTGRGPAADHASPSTSASFSAPVSGSTATDRSGSGEHGGGAVPEVVRWVRRGFEEDARPVAEMVDPALLRGPALPKKEVVAAFHVALACTEADPDLRPRMKAVADSLDKIGS
ncbi:receptor protein kinase-like protein ZAR1 [Miscanthus floridulus]|uniref:receptor protein kinase-like protein ZAR1 n=1 Tax=Miscanthus floridulus TaxID=154761 RepID=UPI00345B0282